jgi:hypothetical protein
MHRRVGLASRSASQIDNLEATIAALVRRKYAMAEPQQEAPMAEEWLPRPPHLQLELQFLQLVEDSVDKRGDKDYKQTIDECLTILRERALLSTQPTESTRAIVEVIARFGARYELARAKGANEGEAFDFALARL